MKHYRLKDSRFHQSPWLYFEVLFDLRDLRFGYTRSTAEHFRAMWGGWDDDTFAWTRDMVQTVDPGHLVEIPPPRQLGWPSTGDAQMIQYLIEYHRFAVWKNRPLGICSRPAESRDEFKERCLQAAQPELNAQLRRIREIFIPRFSEAESKWETRTRAETDIRESTDQRLIRIREFFSGVHERLGRWLAGERLDSPPDILWEEPVHVEPAVLEHVEKLRGELAQRCRQAFDEYLAKAQQIEPDAIRPQLSQIQIVTRGVLWA